MPSLTLGAGIAKGAEAFVNSFTQGKMYEQQMKMQKNQIIIQALYRQLEDDTIPYSQRAKILDAIPELAGIKVDVPLSQQFGLHEMLDEDVVTKEGQAAPKPNEDVQTSSVGNPNDTGLSSSGQVYTPPATLKGNVETEKGQDIPAQTKKYGDMTPLEYKTLLVRKQQALSQDDEFKRAKRLAELNFELQEKSYRANGYTRVLAQGTNADGEYSVVLANASGDKKEIKMPAGFKPIQQIVAESKSSLPAAVRAYSAYYEGQTNPDTGLPYTPEEAQARGLELYKEHGDKLFNINVAKGEQDVSGNKPRTPEQIEDDKRADEQLRLTRQNLLLQYQARADEAEAALTAFDSSIQEQEQIVSQRQKDFDAVKEDYDASEPEYQRALDALDREKSHLNNLKKQRGDVEAKSKAAKKLATNYESSLNGSNNAISPGNVELNDEQKAKVAFARQKNPEATKNMSDLEIWSQIEAYLKRKK